MENLTNAKLEVIYRALASNPVTSFKNLGHVRRLTAGVLATHGLRIVTEGRVQASAVLHDFGFAVVVEA